MAKTIIMPQKIEDRYCNWRHEHVPTTLKSSKNSSINYVCLDAANCKKFHLCAAIKIAANETKLNYAKCCGVCQRVNYCVHARRNRSTKKPRFIEYEDEREKAGGKDEF